ETAYAGQTMQELMAFRSDAPHRLNPGGRHFRSVYGRRALDSFFQGLDKFQTGEITIRGVLVYRLAKDFQLGAFYWRQVGFTLHGVDHGFVPTGAGRERPSIGTQLEIGDGETVLVALSDHIAPETLRPHVCQCAGRSAVQA